MRLANPSPTGPATVKVLCSEEKGSDVNLASYMLLDGMRDECAQTVLISNDSDLTLPVKLLKDELKKRVIVYAPTTNAGRKPSFELRAAASSFRELRAGPIRASQFPESLTDVHGTFHKPTEWA